MGTLDGLYPEFSGKVEKLLAAVVADKAMPPAAVFMGLRTIEQQDMLYALGRTVKNPDGVSAEKPLGITVTNAHGGQSWHNYGLAVDIVFMPGGKWSWDYKNLPYEELGKMGIACGLEWGGSWQESKKDPPHFQIARGLLVARAKVLYEQGGFQAVWDEVKKRGEPTLLKEA